MDKKRHCMVGEILFGLFLFALLGRFSLGRWTSGDPGGGGDNDADGEQDVREEPWKWSDSVAN
jgi:hypothetical protein